MSVFAASFVFIGLSQESGSLEEIEAKVASVLPDPSEKGWLVLVAPKELDIKDMGAGRRRDGRLRKVLVLSVGEAESRAILMAYNNKSAPRPSSHELFAGILKRTGVSVQRCLIHTMRHDAFFARLDLSQGAGKFSMDCRPSDGMALALRMGGHIYVTRKVFEEAGVDWPPKGDSLEKSRREEPL